MSRLSDLYKAMETLRKEGLPVNEDLEKKASELEEEIIKKEILPVLSKTIEPALQPVKRELVLVVDYVPGQPLSVHLSRKRNFAAELTDAKEMVLDPRWITFRYHHLDYDVTKAADVRFLNVDRALFDEWLLSLLPDTVEVVPSTRLVDVEQSPVAVEVQVRGLTASGARANRALRARYLIAADGPRATVRERLGIRPFDRYITVQEYVRIERGALDPCFDALCCKRFSRDYGIGYLMPKGDVAIVGSVFYPGSTDCERKHEDVLKILRERYPLGESVAREKWFAAHLRRPADLVAGRGRILLAGEGGGFLSCTSGEGISFALNSGIMAGTSVAEAYEAGGRVAGEALARYERKLVPMKKNLAFRMCMFPFMNSTFGKTVACAIPTPIVSKATEHL